MHTAVLRHISQIVSNSIVCQVACQLCQCSIMKLIVVIHALLLQICVSDAASALPEHDAAVVPSSIAAGALRPTHARDLLRRAGRECGDFIFKCKDAEGACNNAWFHVKCVDSSSRTMVYDASNSNNENRKQSGCNASGKSVCNQKPFSQ